MNFAKYIKIGLQSAFTKRMRARQTLR